MSEHKASIRWKFTNGDFLKGRFTREHMWTFDGGLQIPASATPAIVPPPLSNPAAIDPEEAFVASLASCHMLTFLHLASRQGFVVTAYEDDAVGSLTKNDAGKLWISAVALAPKVVYGGDKTPTPDQESQLHHRAHEECFISNSVKTHVVVNR